jgi:hypothetical protein
MRIPVFLGCCILLLSWMLPSALAQDTDEKAAGEAALAFARAILVGDVETASKGVLQVQSGRVAEIVRGTKKGNVDGLKLVGVRTDGKTIATIAMPGGKRKEFETALFILMPSFNPLTAALSKDPAFLAEGAEIGLEHFLKSAENSGERGPAPLGLALHPKIGWRVSPVVITSVGPLDPEFHQKALKELKTRFERWKKDGAIDAYVILSFQEKKVSMVTFDKDGSLRVYVATIKSPQDIKNLRVGSFELTL